MWFWYNTQLITDKELILNPSNRAFQYGDGIFETLIIKNGEIQHLPYHGERLKRSTKALKLNFILSIEEIENRLKFLIKKNSLVDARAKIMIWRQEGGYYIPTNNNTQYLMLVKKHEEPDLKPNHLEVCKTVRIPMGITQNCKTLNSLPYVMAGIELNDDHPNADDLLILDCNQFLCECISSNIFWIKDGAYYTPSLETNCVAGVKRQVIIDKLANKNIEINEVKATLDDIMDADYAFKSNVTGIYPIKSLAEKSFDVIENLNF